MNHIEYCKISNFDNPNKTAETFIDEMKELFLKYKVESIGPYLTDWYIGFMPDHHFYVNGVDISGNNK